MIISGVIWVQNVPFDKFMLLYTPENSQPETITRRCTLKRPLREILHNSQESYAMELFYLVKFQP